MLSVRSILASARRVALDVEALVLPLACLGCERHGAVLCEQCAYALRTIAPPRCVRCGQTVDPWDSGSREPGAAVPTVRTRGTAPGATAPCGFCREWPEALAWTASATWYEDVAPRLVKALKYGGWRVAAVPMADCMAERLFGRPQGPPLHDPWVLVPVPLGRVRLRERGHNQAELIARALSERTGTRVLDALVRQRETRTQTSLHPRERRANVAGAFGVRGAGCEVRGKDVVLVDDVLTTGATLVAAAEALVAAGARSVGAVTFARALKPGDHDQ